MQIYSFARRLSSLDLSLVPQTLLSTVIVNIHPCQLNTNYHTHVSAYDVDILVYVLRQKSSSRLSNKCNLARDNTEPHQNATNKRKYKPT
jgi:hypothetical protein